MYYMYNLHELYIVSLKLKRVSEISIRSRDVKG